MAATGGEKQEDDRFGSESLWIPAARGGQRGGRRVRGDSKRKRKSSQSRANLNGGELGGKMQSQGHQ